MKSKSIAALIAVLSFGLSLASVSPADASPRKMLSFAKKELKLKPRETQGDNIPKYTRGGKKIRNTVAPYTLWIGYDNDRQYQPWSFAFVSYGITKAAGVTFDYTKIPTVSGVDVITYGPHLRHWASLTKRLSKRAKVGYVALVGENFEHTGVVSKVKRGKATQIIRGDANNTVRKQNVKGKMMVYIKT